MRFDFTEFVFLGAELMFPSLCPPVLLFDLLRLEEVSMAVPALPQKVRHPVKVPEMWI
jgi:hypothetical protein